MRMIGIGLLGFLLAGIGLWLSTMNVLDAGQRYVNAATGGPELVFENRVATDPSNDFHAAIHRSNPNHPVILSGLPAYQGVAFHMPVDARPVSGYLQIDATLQVLDGVSGVLRISIDNVRRGEMLLHPGVIRRSLKIPLSNSDISRAELPVSFSLQGDGPQNECSTDLGIQAVVEIETTSAVYLTLDRPLVSARDRIHAWGNIAQIAWPDWLAPEERLRRVILATQFKQRGIDTVLTDTQQTVASNTAALNTNELRVALPHFPQPDTVTTSGPRRFAQAGPNAGLRRFHRETVWRTRYPLGQAGTAPSPAALQLHLALGQVWPDAQWALTVTLNNRLVHQQLVANDAARLSVDVALPHDMQSALNLIEVTASYHHAQDRNCNRGPELVAEMLPDTQLIPGDILYASPLTQLRTTLAEMSPMQLGSFTPLGISDAHIASGLLADLMPQSAQMRPALATAQIVIVAPTDAPITLPKTGPIWHVSRNPATRALVVTSLDGGPFSPMAHTAILVIPQGLPLDVPTQ